MYASAGCGIIVVVASVRLSIVVPLSPTIIIVLLQWSYTATRSIWLLSVLWVLLLAVIGIVGHGHLVGLLCEGKVVGTNTTAPRESESHYKNDRNHSDTDTDANPRTVA